MTKTKLEKKHIFSSLASVTSRIGWLSLAGWLKHRLQIYIRPDHFTPVILSASEALGM